MFIQRCGSQSLHTYTYISTASTACLGWTYNPIMATELLSKTLAWMGPTRWEVTVYFDDILISALDPQEVETTMQRLRNLLVEDRWRISPKSIMEAQTHIQWMGQDLSGMAWSISSSPEYTSGMIALWVSLTTCGY